MSKEPAKKKKTKQSNLHSFIMRNSSNKEKLEKKIVRKREAESMKHFDEAAEKKIKTEVKLFEQNIRLQNASILREKKEEALDKAAKQAADELTAEMATWSLSSPPAVGKIPKPQVQATRPTSRTAIRTTVELRGHQFKCLTWKDRAAGIFLFLHPQIFGSLPEDQAIVQAATVLGVEAQTMRKWAILENKSSHNHIPKWYPFLKKLTWGEVKKSCRSDFCNSFSIPESSNVNNQLKKHQEVAEGSMKKFVSHFTGGSAKGRKKLAQCEASTTAMCKATRKVTRKDKGVPRKWILENQFVANFIRRQWELGDPATRESIVTELRLDVLNRENNEFHNSYLAAGKEAQLSRFVTDVIKREGFAVRKKSIGQTVPDNWREQAVEAAEIFRSVLKEEDVDDVVSADQTFVVYCNESKFVVAPAGVRRVGGHVKADCKNGFTLMVTASLKSSNLQPAFLVFNGTKMDDAKIPSATNDFKFQKWDKVQADESFGGTASVHHQEKHWFDGTITARYVRWLCDECYPRKKVGLLWDHAPSHVGEEARAVISKCEREGKLVVLLVPRGLTSIMQVCDLVVNKELKRMIKDKYQFWRSVELNFQRKRVGLNKQINLKVPTEVMIRFVEEAIVDFNHKQNNSEGTPSIKKGFRIAGQDPWFDHCEEQFLAHLKNLEEQSSMCKRGNTDLLEEELIGNQISTDIEQ